MALINYNDKQFLNENASIPAENKVSDTDMNEIKNVVNNNYNEVGDILDLETADKTSIVTALNEIYGDVFYSSGETYQISGQVYVGGGLTGSSKSVLFTVFLPKRVNKITSLSVSGLNVAIRHTGGGYWMNGEVASSNIEVVDFKANYVTLGINASTATGTNNTPCSVYIRSLTLTFS